MYTEEQYRRATTELGTIPPDKIDIVVRNIEEYEAEHPPPKPPMYTEEQYSRAKGAIESLPNKYVKSKVLARMQEYEAQRPASPAEAIAQSESTGAGASLDGDSKLGQFIETQAPKPPSQAPSAQAPRTYLPPEPGAGLSEEDEARLLAPPLVESAPLFTTPPAFLADENLDFDLPNASKLKKFGAETEYTPKSSVSALATIAKNMAIDSGAGASSTMHFEPSEEQFRANMAQYLEARNLHPGSKGYDRAFEVYKDAAWKRAYDQAVAEDRPITRVAYTQQKGWAAVQNYLAESSDTYTAFVDGMARGYAGPTQQIATAVRDRALGRNDVAGLRERQDRSPIASALGTMVGGSIPGSLGGRVAGQVVKRAGPLVEKLVEKLPGKLLPGAVGRYATAILAGGTAADAELVANTIGELGSDAIAGQPVNPEAIRELPKRLVGATLVGGVGGGVGEAVAHGASGYRNWLRSPTSEVGQNLSQAEAAGMTTSYKSGITPSDEVREILERVRTGDPKNKLPALGDPLDYAVEDVAPHIANQHLMEHGRATARMEAETADALARNTSLMDPKQVKELVETIRTELITRSQPGSADKYAPNDALAAWKNDQLRDLLKNLTEAEPVLAVDAAAHAARNGGKLVSVAEARRLGFDVKIDGQSMPPRSIPPGAPEAGGVPSEAPPLADSDSAITLPKVKTAYEHVPDSELFDIQEHPFLGSSPPPANTFTTPKDDLPSVMNRFLGPPPARAPGAVQAAAQEGPALPSFVNDLPFPSKPPPALTIPKGIPETEYMVLLKPRAYDAPTMESVKKSIDLRGKAASRLGDPDKVWDDLIGAVRKDRDQFSDAEWSELKERHHDELTRLEQQRDRAGITEEQLFQHMQNPSQTSVRSVVKGYGAPGKLVEAVDIQGFADRAGVRPELENVRGTRAYIALNDSASPQFNLGSRRGLVRSLLAGAGLRGDAFARDLSRGPSGETLYTVKGLNPEAAARTNTPLGRSLLPSGSLLAFGRGAGGVKTGSIYENATSSERATGTVDPEQQRIIENYLSQP